MALQVSRVTSSTYLSSPSQPVLISSALSDVMSALDVLHARDEPTDGRVAPAIPHLSASFFRRLSTFASVRSDTMTHIAVYVRRDRSPPPLAAQASLSWADLSPRLPGHDTAWSRGMDTHRLLRLVSLQVARLSRERPTLPRVHGWLRLGAVTSRTETLSPLADSAASQLFQPSLGALRRRSQARLGQRCT